MLNIRVNTLVTAVNALKKAEEIVLSNGGINHYENEGKRQARIRTVATAIELIDRKLINKKGSSLSLPAEFPVIELALQQLGLIKASFGVDFESEVATNLQRISNRSKFNMTASYGDWFNPTNTWRVAGSTDTDDTIDQYFQNSTTVNDASVIFADFCSGWKWSNDCYSNLLSNKKAKVLICTHLRARESDLTLFINQSQSCQTQAMRSHIQHILNDKDVERELAYIHRYLRRLNADKKPVEKATLIDIYRYNSISPMVVYSFYIPERKNK